MVPVEVFSSPSETVDQLGIPVPARVFLDEGRSARTELTKVRNGVERDECLLILDAIDNEI